MNSVNKIHEKVETNAALFYEEYKVSRSSITFTFLCIAHYHKLRTSLSGLYKVYTYDIADL